MDPNPLIGQSVASIDKKGYSWFFSLSGGDSVITECAWRLVSTDRVVVTSQDDGQLFGRSAPVDACEEAAKVLGSEPITEATHDGQTGDLCLWFSKGRYLEFLQLSSGYEAWRLTMGGKEYICMGGGEYTCLGAGKTS